MTLKELLISGWYRLLYRKFEREEIIFLYRREKDLEKFSDAGEWPEFILCRLNVHTLEAVHHRIDFSLTEPE